MSENIGQPTPVQRVQNQIDELTRERDLYKRMLERYEPDPTYSTPTEIDRLRARVAELEAAGIDARTDHRVIATDSDGMRAESEWKRDRDLVESWASLWESEGWTVHSIESRTVSTTTRTTAWKAGEA